MKKRNEEGYVLVYVMVVIFTVCFIALALMSNTLRTLQAQESMVQRMKDKYEAMGEIERVVAELEYDCEHTLDGSGYSSPSAAESAAEEAFITFIKDFASRSNSDPYEYMEKTPDPDIPSSKEYYLLIDLEIDSIAINATMQLILEKSDYGISPIEDLDYDENLANWLLYGDGNEDTKPQKYTYNYSIADVVFSFTSYQIGGAT